jgi:hypothetical protein
MGAPLASQSRALDKTSELFRTHRLCTDESRQKSQPPFAGIAVRLGLNDRSAENV